ncbi:MAG: hypothetical protein AAFU57_08050 [Bacteroidota bacterium]
MGNTKGLGALLTTPQKEEVEKNAKSQQSQQTTTATRQTSKGKSRKKAVKGEAKDYRSFYITPTTSSLVNRVVNTIKIDKEGYTQDMAINEAFILLAKANGVKIKR